MDLKFTDGELVTYQSAINNVLWASVAVPVLILFSIATIKPKDIKSKFMLQFVIYGLMSVASIILINSTISYYYEFTKRISESDKNKLLTSFEKVQSILNIILLVALLVILILYTFNKVKTDETKYK